MVESDWLYAIGNPHRVEIMRRFLATGTATPAALADALGVPLGTVSYHIRFLAKRGVLRLAGRTRRRGASVHHYQLVNRERVASVLWGMRAALLVTDFERDNGRSDATVTLDPEALAELRTLTAAYLARIGELGLQTRERRSGDDARRPDLTKVAVLLATDEGGERAPPVVAMIKRGRTPTRRKPSEDTTRFLVGLAAVTRMIRARDKLSQAEVARRAGVGPRFVSAVEQGKANPSTRRLGQLAEGLGLAGATELAAKAEDAARRIADATIPPTE